MCTGSSVTTSSRYLATGNWICMTSVHGRLFVPPFPCRWIIAMSAPFVLPPLTIHVPLPLLPNDRVTPPPSDGRRVRSQVRAGGSSTNQTWDAWGVAATRAGDWMSGLIHSHRRTFPSLPFLQGCPATRLPRGIISRLQNMHAGRMAASCMFDRLPPHPVGRHRVTPFLPYRRK